MLGILEEQLETSSTRAMHSKVVLMQEAKEDPLGTLLPRVMRTKHAMKQERLLHRQSLPI